ncbi:MAG: YtxH domain-containing protein [Terriglobales bacterium]|jgi:gas vesicle protein
MRNFGTKNRVNDWVRLGAKLSLLFTDPKVRSAIGDQLKDRVDNLTDTVTSKYEDAADRVQAAAAAFQGKRNWPSRVASFMLGVGIGAGLGVLLAPASGAETRDAVRDKAVAMKNRVFESAAGATEKIRQSVNSVPFTGTEG